MEQKNMVSAVDEQLRAVVFPLTDFLKKYLPATSQNWWQEAVIPSLTPAQQYRLQRFSSPSLEELDLAALLRVLDNNWYFLNDPAGLDKKDRVFVKEMREVRNRWAHLDTTPLTFDETFRTLDTIDHLARIIKADNVCIEGIKKAKEALRRVPCNTPIRPAEESVPALSQESSPQLPQTETASQIPCKSVFSPGSMVEVIADSGTLGCVRAVRPGIKEDSIEVVINGKIKKYYASQLRLIPQEASWEELSCEEFQARLSAMQIDNPMASTLYSLRAARIQFIPYQFRPVLRFIRSERPRMLIADSVGVGKTIEAALILRELQARRDIRSVLVICPKPLIVEGKWRRELKRFGEDFEELDGSALRQCMKELFLDGVWPEKKAKCIIPYSLFTEELLYGEDSDKKKGRKRQWKGLLKTNSLNFDLVIVDEAHHVRHPDTYAAQAVKFFCDQAEAVVFLTATPIQTKNEDLFELLNLLRPDLVIDQASFQQMTAPNAFINEAVRAIRLQQDGWKQTAHNALENACATEWGQSLLRHDPGMQRVLNVLSSVDAISREERVRLISDTEELHTLSGMINRTRRCDIGNFTIRRPQTLKVSFTEAQQVIHDKLLELRASLLQRHSQSVNLKFMMSTLMRQAASCIFGLADQIEEILSPSQDQDQTFVDAIAESDWEINANLLQSDTLFQREGRQLQAMAKLLRDSEDPKLDALCRIIKDKQAATSGNHRIMVFSSFRHTLYYLEAHLLRRGIRVGLIHGGVPDYERVHLRERFELEQGHEDGLDVLLFSEVGCEGLDYQFCDFIVNYDLPWNPMRIEQRIGRIDRQGQQSEAVTIVNMITEGTIDAEIYERCLWRIGIFHQELGCSEAILGEINKELSSIVVDDSLTPEEMREKLEQLADNEIRLIREQEKLEQEQAELMGITLSPEMFQKDIENATSAWLSPTALQHLVQTYLRKRLSVQPEVLLGAGGRKTLRLSAEARRTLHDDLKALYGGRLPYSGGIELRRWENWLLGSDQHLPLTFEDKEAARDSGIAFIEATHPLVRQAAQNVLQDCSASADALVSLQAASTELEPGEYRFLICQWQYSGLRQEQMFKVISSDSRTEEVLSSLLKSAVNSSEPTQEWTDEEKQELEERHYLLWTEAREKHLQTNRDTAEGRRKSLAISHSRTLERLNDKLNVVTDERIRKMHMGKIAKAESLFEGNVKKIDAALQNVDIEYSIIAYGVMNIRREM